MASKIVFFIFTVLNVCVIWTTAFPSDVHEYMTPEERSAMFGSADGSVPDYEVFPMSLPPRGKRQADDEIHLKVKINNTEINLNFKPTAGYLATRYTPVWSAISDEEAYNKIRYDPLPNAMKDIGEFKMYQDVDNEAAIVVYTDSDNEAIIEGIVTSDYAIRTLPKRLMDQTLKVGDNHFIETPLLHKRSIEPDSDEVTGYYVLFKSPPSDRKARRNVYRLIEKREIHTRERRRSRTKAVYPEILLILDHNAIRNHTITQALRFMLAFWNGVDMVYSMLDDPKVHLNIAGIIISADDAATPYIAKNTSIQMKAHGGEILHGLAMYFGKEQDRFPLGHYDMVLAMTTIKLCNEQTEPCEALLGVAHLSGACTPKDLAKRHNIIRGVGVIYYNWMYGGVDTAIHESAHLFGVDHDEGQGVTSDCHYTEGYAMAAAAQFAHQSLKWSPCSKRFFQRYFSTKKSQCLDNTPLWTKPVKKVLPGRWLTLDGQCRNSGFEKSCQVPDFPVCMVKGCKAPNSNECEISEFIPLPGTKCGNNKYCELGTGCVDE